MSVQDKVDALRNKIASVRSRITGRESKPANFNAGNFLSDFKSRAQERISSMPMLSERPLLQRATGNKYAGGDLQTGMSRGVSKSPTEKTPERKGFYY